VTIAQTRFSSALDKPDVEICSPENIGFGWKYPKQEMGSLVFERTD